jgi:prolyl oligopeptidase
LNVECCSVQIPFCSFFLAGTCSRLAGASWMAEYGNPETDGMYCLIQIFCYFVILTQVNVSLCLDWEFLQKYSPYHNIDATANYPPMIITTSTRDDRVHPAHARKMTKKLLDLAENTGKNWKVYYYENIEGGHGGAADAKQSAFMTALSYDFMFDTLRKNILAESTGTGK